MATVLVIDDDALVRAVSFRRCSKTLVARSSLLSVRGMALFRGEKPDLVITDIMMPKTGWHGSHCGDMQGRPQGKGHRDIGCGRVGNVDFLTIAQAVAAMRVIPKPFDLDELIACVEECLDEHDCPIADTGVTTG